MNPEKCPVCGTVGEVQTRVEDNRTTTTFLACGHERIFARFHDGTETITDEVKVPSNPSFILQQLIQSKQHFQAIVISTALFEKIGLDRLQQYQNQRGMSVSPRKLSHLRVSTIILFLYLCGIIKESTYHEMIEVNQV